MKSPNKGASHVAVERIVSSAPWMWSTMLRILSHIQYSELRRAVAF